MSAGWSRFCVVGLGGHARSKLVPAIAANRQELAGIVSRKREAAELGAPVFTSVEDAVAALPADTVFVIASPPAAHFGQVQAAVTAGRDVIVEKPAFVTSEEAREAVAAAERSGALLVEGFMNRHTHTHRHFIEACSSAPPVEINCAFTIPEAPPDTFRSDPGLGSSNLYDMGCYLLATLLDAGLLLDGLELDGVDHAGIPDRERLHLRGVLDGVRVSGLIGVDDTYANRLELHSAEGTVAYQPFFYGRQAEREISVRRGGVTGLRTIADVNAFEAMFALPRAYWRATAGDRAERMIALTSHLERLGRSLAAARGA